MKNKNIAINLANYLSENNPQVKNEKLNWYFAGSLSNALLSKARIIEDLNIAEDKTMTRISFKKLSIEEQERLQHLNRKLNDNINIVSTSKDKPNHLIFPSSNNINKDVANLQELVNNPIKKVKDEGSTKFIKDHNVSRITMSDGNFFYITSPIAALAYKLDKTIECYQWMSKPDYSAFNKPEYDKSITDFTNIYYGIKDFYPEDKILTETDALLHTNLAYFPQQANLKEALANIYQDASIKLQNIGGTKTDIADLHSYLNNMLIKDEKAKTLKKVI
jgi:hypothetical protein